VIYDRQETYIETASLYFGFNELKCVAYNRHR